jgi:L-threonylcarbamoyladenylate synthase
MRWSAKGACTTARRRAADAPDGVVAVPLTRTARVEWLDGQNALDVARAAALLRAGAIGGVPTETVYGLAAHALDERAVARVFAAKRRPSFDPLIVHVRGVRGAAESGAGPWLDEVAQLGSADWAAPLLQHAWPGPLTLVLPRQACVPDLVTSGLPDVAVRAPAHPVMQALLQQAGIPLAAPSANPFGYVSPTTAAHVAEQLGDAIDFVLDGGPCAVGVESTIVAHEADGLVILRHGGLSREAIEGWVGPVRDGVRVLERPLVPGQLARHYATATRLRLIGPGVSLQPSRTAALLVPLGKTPSGVEGYGRVLELSPDGSEEEMAARLFGALRSLDTAAWSHIDVLPCPEVGLGRAVMDRLRRAATPPEGE